MAETERAETHTTTHAVHEKPKMDLLSNILAIVGLIILVVIIIWGLLHLATLTGPWLSSLFSRGPTIQITAPSSVTSGTSFTMNWKYSTSEKGTYAFLYPCKSGLQFQTPSAAGASNVIPCGAAFAVSTTNNSLSLTPRLSGASSLDVSLSIIFIPSATSSKQVQGGATVKINLPAAQAKSVEPITPANPGTPRAVGPADLSVSMISATADQYGNATIVFDIGNVGGSTSPSYYFTAQLPTVNGYTYTSPQQASLASGDHIVNTLRFSQATPGTVSVSLNISDANQGNNYGSAALSMPYTPGQTYNQYYNNYTQSYPQSYYNSQPYYQYQYNQPYQYQQMYPYYTY